jgi:hypothetical protein
VAAGALHGRPGERDAGQGGRAGRPAPSGSSGGSRTAPTSDPARCASCHQAPPAPPAPHCRLDSTGIGSPLSTRPLTTRSAARVRASPGAAATRTFPPCSAGGPGGRGSPPSAARTQPARAPAVVPSGGGPPRTGRAATRPGSRGPRPAPSRRARRGRPGHRARLGTALLRSPAGRRRREARGPGRARIGETRLLARDLDICFPPWRSVSWRCEVPTVGWTRACSSNARPVYSLRRGAVVAC